MQVAFFQQNFSDSVVKVNGVSVTPHTFTQILANNSDFFVAQDDDGVDDFCTNIPSGTTMTLEVAPTGGGSNYIITSQPFVGGRPPHRPH